MTKRVVGKVKTQPGKFYYVEQKTGKVIESDRGRGRKKKSKKKK